MLHIPVTLCPVNQTLYVEVICNFMSSYSVTLCPVIQEHNIQRLYHYMSSYSVPLPGLQKVLNWLGPDQNWLSSAVSKIPQKNSTYKDFHLFIYIAFMFFFAPFMAFGA